MTNNIIMKNYNGSGYDELYPKTIAEQVIESPTRKFITQTQLTKLDGLSNGTVVEKSLINGNVKINSIETVVYTIPTLTKTTVGLANVDNTTDMAKPVSTAQNNALNLKVDKVAGKQLSTEDFTLANKNKLNGLKRTVASSVEPVGSEIGDVWYQIV